MTPVYVRTLTGREGSLMEGEVGGTAGMRSTADLRAEARDRFLLLSPIERAETMHRVIAEIIALRAQAEGVSEREIYQRYLRDNPRHYQRLTG